LVLWVPSLQWRAFEAAAFLKARNEEDAKPSSQAGDREARRERERERERESARRGLAARRRVWV
jgi:hypothetical protein